MLLDGIRTGSALLGRIPDAERFGLRRTGICRVSIECIKQLPKGTTVGYGSTFHTRKDTTVALCPIGTHNGFGMAAISGSQDLLSFCMDTVRHLYGRIRGHGIPYGIVNGKRCCVLGRISTEITLLDVTGTPCAAGDAVEFEINPMFLHDVPILFADQMQADLTLQHLE